LFLWHAVQMHAACAVAKLQCMTSLSECEICRCMFCIVSFSALKMVSIDVASLTATRVINFIY
jgi:hypothetical protein